MSLFDVNELCMEIFNIKIDNVCEKVLSVFGESGKELGKEIDELTKDITIVIKNDK